MQQFASNLEREALAILINQNGLNVVLDELQHYCNERISTALVQHSSPGCELVKVLTRDRDLFAYVKEQRNK